VPKLPPPDGAGRAERAGGFVWCYTCARRAAVQRLERWRSKHRDHYNAYMARYMRGYRKRKREAAARDVV